MAYTKKTWINLPNQTTPINATGMNDLETRIKALDTSIDNMIGATTTTTKSIPNNLRINGADLNAIEGTGLFIAFGPCTNVPMYEGVVTNHWYLVQIEYSSDYRFQMIQRLSGANDTFTRVKIRGEWSEWLSRNPNNYSTSEIKIGTWEDKPLYRKLINFGTLPNNTSKSVNTNISNIDKIINGTAFSVDSNGDVGLPIPYITSSSNVVTISYTKASITITSNFNVSNRTAVIVLEYTKTTD